MPTATGGAPAADDTDSKDDDDENLFEECDFDNGMICLVWSTILDRAIVAICDVLYNGIYYVRLTLPFCAF